METSTVDYGSLFAPVVGQVTDGITQILPYGVTIFGVVLAIGIGTKVFKRLAGK